MVSLIVAMSENRVIGRDNTLPWRLPNDLKHFRRTTTGHPVIMGRKTYESIGKPLPNRTNIVVTRTPGYAAPGCWVAHSLEEALALAPDDPEVFVIGGAEIYARALPLADRIYLTLVHAEVEGDIFFPEWDETEWLERSSKRHEPDAEHTFAYSFVTLERVSRPLL